MTQNSETLLWCTESEEKKQVKVPALPLTYYQGFVSSSLSILHNRAPGGSNETSSVKTLGKLGQDNVSSCIQSPGKLSLSSPVWLLGKVCFKWSNTCTKSPSNLLGTGRYSIKVNNYQAPPPPPLTSTALVCLKKPSRYCAASCSTHFTLFLELFSMPGTNAHWSCVTFPQVHPFLAASTMKPICSSRSHHSMMTDTILNDCSSQEYLQFTMA